MEKFKEAVMKHFTTVQKTPLSETQEAVLQERVSQCISLLHTPDHPPYAWMIERALRELNETRGSSEDSISKFIRKEYNDLPWSHFTMLEYHLARLCESGELVLTSGQRYLLAFTNSDKKIRTKSRRKKRKKGWDREIIRSKRRRKVTRNTNMLQKGDKDDKVEVLTSNEIHEEKECTVQAKLKDNYNEMLCKQQKHQRTSGVNKQEVRMLDGNKQLKSDEVELFSGQLKCCGVSKYVNEERDGVMEGSERQESEVEVRTGLMNLSFTKDNGANCNPNVRSSSTPSLLRNNNLLKFGQQQRANEPIVGSIYSASSNAQLDWGSKRLEDNYVKHATLERPPGFETVTSEGSSQFQTQIAEQLNQNCVHDFSGGGVKSSETEIIDIEKSSGDKALGKGQTSMEHLSMEHQRQKKVAQENQTSRVLRSQVPREELSKAGTSAKFLAPLDHRERLIPDHRVGMLPEAKSVIDELNLNIHKQDMAPKSMPCKDAIGVVKKKFRGRGRPPKARPLIGDMASLTDHDQQFHAHPPLETLHLDSTSAEMSDLESVDNLEQQLDKPRRGRPPKPNGESNTVLTFNLKYKTIYRGRGRPRLTDSGH